jgi:tetratricopeptide (TPR) repeat protein
VHDADKYFRRLERLSIDDMRLRAETLVRGQYWPDAIVAYRSLLERVPNDVPAQERLIALLLNEQVNFEEAISWAGRLTASGSSAGVGHFFLGNIYHMLHRPAVAVAHFERFLELDPELPSVGAPANLVREDLVGDLLVLGKAAEAQSHLNRQPAAARGWNWFWLGSSARLQQDDADGFQSLRVRAFELDPPSGESARRPESAPFLGAHRCGSCHQEIFERQQSSNHARTFRRASHQLFDAIPRGPITDPGDRSVQHLLRLDRQANSEELVTWVVQQGSSTVSTGVEYAIGSGTHGFSLLFSASSKADRQTNSGQNERSDFGRQPIELRMSYYGLETGWALTPGHSPQPDPALENFLGRRLNLKELQGCFDCHTTGPWPGTAPAAHQPLDPGVSCESCHGPGANHLRAVQLDTDDLAILHPGRLDARELANLCGRCHKAAVTGQPSPEKASQSQPDTFSSSRCFRGSQGKLNCVTCHDPHENVERSLTRYEPKCLNCHQGGRSPTCPVNPKHNCVECHMPIVPGLLHTRVTDHAIRARPLRQPAM